MTRDALRAPARWPRVTPTFTLERTERARQHLVEVFWFNRLTNPRLAARASRAHAELLRNMAKR